MAEETLADRMDRAFRESTIFVASDEELKAYLVELGTSAIPNQDTRHRAVNRCQVISTVRTFRFMEAIERDNAFLSKVALAVGIFAAGLAIYSLIDSNRSSKALNARGDAILAVLESQRVLESEQADLLRSMGSKPARGGKVGSKK